MAIQLGPSCPFSLDLTLCCGQAFRWDKRSDWWYGVVGDKALKVRQTEDQLEFSGADEDFVRKYFGLHDNLSQICLQINKDKHIEAAIGQFRGLRILRQDPWECLISYICATYKSIAAIKRMLSELSGKFGKEISFAGNSFYAFPNPVKLAKASISSLMECGLGYRAKYVSETAKKVCEDCFEFEYLKKAAYSKAKEALLEFKGVGPKVADCVLLFGLEKLEAFPVDVWVRRALLRHYATHFPRKFVHKTSREEALSNLEYKRFNLFGREYFGKYAGYAQEYLYHWERTENRG